MLIDSHEISNKFGNISFQNKISHCDGKVSSLCETETKLNLLREKSKLKLIRITLARTKVSELRKR